MLREKFTSFCFVSCFHSDSLQIAPDSVGLYAQQVSRCGRDGEVALGLLFFNCSDMGPVRRAADREAVSTADVRAGTSVVVDHLESRTAALVDSAAFTGRGIPLHRVDAVLATLAAASLFEVGHRSPSRGSVRRGPSWGSPSLSLSADATHVLFTLLVPMFLSGGVFAYCVVSDVATRSHFVSRGLRAANAVVLALEELSDCGVLRSVEWRGQLFPVAPLREAAPTLVELRAAWSLTQARQRQVIACLDEVESFLDVRACVSRRLCALFGEDGEGDAALLGCRGYVCAPEFSLNY